MYKYLYTFLISGLCVLTTVNTHANDVFAYPSGGQSMEQQQKDQYECHQWSVSQTGFDPINSSQQQNYAYSSPSNSSSSGGFGDAETGQGGMVRDGARGAALGAIGGAIAGDAGQGAAIGAATGALFGRMRRRGKQAEQQQWEQQQAQQAQMQQQQQASKQAIILIVLIVFACHLEITKYSNNISY